MGDETFIDTEPSRSESKARKPFRWGGRDRNRNVRAERNERLARRFRYEQGLPPEQPPTDTKAKRASTSGRSMRLKIDVPLLLITSTLIIVGMVMLFSASWKYSLAESGSPWSIFIKQLAFTMLGIGLAITLTFIDYHLLQRVALPIMAVTVVGLVAVLLVHDERNGAVRTLFGGSIQPSELAKLIILIYLSVWLYNRQDQLHELGFGLLPLGVILGLIGGLIALQPDASTVITIGVLGMMMFFLAGGELRQVLIVMALGIIVGYLVVRVDIFSTATERINSFLIGLRDPLQASDHVQRSMEAFVKGGWVGVGIGKAGTKLTVLPFPHTDSIFAVVGEETGVLGASFLVAIYGVLMWRGLIIARRAPDMLGSVLAAGLSFWIAMEAFVNMAVMVGLLPFAGNALPLVSAGGSSRVVVLAAIGIIFNISRLSEKTKEEVERSFNAVIDLRRRDWRRGVSRPRRPSSPKV